MSPTAQIRPTIVRLLENLGGAKEVQQYLRRFSSVDAERFAVIKVGGAVLRDSLDELVSSLGFLQQVGLTPVVLHGAGPQLDEAMAAEGIAKRVVDGMRVTDPTTLRIVRRVARAQNLAVVEALQAEGLRATSILGNVFEATMKDADRLGLVGDVAAVDLESVIAATRVGSVPVIASLGETASGQIVNINADVAARALIEALLPYKIVFLTETGALLDQHGEPIEAVNLATDREALFAAPWLHSGMRVKLTEIADLLDALPLSSSVSITKPADLARELFTHRGSGTLIRRGERILSFTAKTAVDRARLEALISRGFGRPLSSGWFDALPGDTRFFLSEHYRAALVVFELAGTRFLDKFAVDRDAQGEGLGRAAWQAMRATTPQLFWRARRDNPANGFYLTEADGMIKQGEWQVFWYGIADLDALAPLIDAALSRPATLAAPDGESE